MKANEYKSQREQRGSQAAVAALLGVNRVTIAKRETGQTPISREAELALRSIPIKGQRRLAAKAAPK